MDFESLSDILKHWMRRKILLALYEKKNLSYVDLMELVGATNTGKFNYHLKILGDLIEKEQNGRYSLTEKGQTVAEILQKFPDRKTQQTPIGMADATLIGFAGVVMTVVNPVLWVSMFIAFLELELNVPFFIFFALSSFAYALLVPGAVMWMLTVRRTNSHDMYDLLKPPFVTFILLLFLLIAMLLLKIDLTATIKSPSITQVSDSIPQTSYSMMQTSLNSSLFQGLVLCFVGVIIAEFIDKRFGKG